MGEIKKKNNGGMNAERDKELPPATDYQSGYSVHVLFWGEFLLCLPFSVFILTVTPWFILLLEVF